MARGSMPQEPGETGGAAASVAAEERADPIEGATPPARRVLVTGAAGFIGSHLLPRLVSRGHMVRAVWRGREGPGRRTAPGADWRLADITRPETLVGLARECDAIVHLAGSAEPRDGTSLERLNAIGTRNVLRAATDSVERVVYVSALGASPAAGAYFRSRFQAEDAVMSCGLEYVILRPSVIYGPFDHFVTAIADLLRRLPVFPMLGDGSFQLQPLAVEDMVDAVTQSVERPDVRDGLYEIAGPERLRFTGIVRTIGDVTGRRRPIFPIPDRIATRAVRLARRMGLQTPFSREQLDVLRWGNVLSGHENPLRTVFRVKPLPFRDAVADYWGASPSSDADAGSRGGDT